MYFHQIGPLGRFSLIVVMSVHIISLAETWSLIQSQFAKQHLIGQNILSTPLCIAPQITWSDPGLSLVYQNSVTLIITLKRSITCYLLMGQGGAKKNSINKTKDTFSPFKNPRRTNGDTISIGREIRCLPYAGFIHQVKILLNISFQALTVEAWDQHNDFREAKGCHKKWYRLNLWNALNPQR